MILSESGTKRIIELHKNGSSAISEQLATDREELEKLVGTSYLQSRTRYGHDAVLSKWTCSYEFVIAGLCYVEEQITGIPFTCTCTDAGEVYLGTTRGYSNIPCKFEYTTTDGIVHVDNREMGMVSTAGGLAPEKLTLRIDQVVNHIRFVSDCFSPIQTLNYCYVFK